MVREVSASLLLLALLEDQGQTNTPHPCVQQKKGKKKWDPEEKSRVQTAIEKTRTDVQEQSRETAEGDVDQRCISVIYFRDCGKRKKKKGRRSSRKNSESPVQVRPREKPWWGPAGKRGEQ